MIRIAMLQGRDTRDRVFTPKHIEQLRTLGELVMNEEEGSPSKEQIHRLIAGADIVITSWGCGAFGEEELALVSQLRAVLHAAGTVKGIATPALWERGIRVAGGAPAIGRNVAESVLGFMITSLKDMWRVSQDIREGKWEKGANIRELFGMTIGLIGAGSVGRYLIKLLHNFDVKILVNDPMLTNEEAGQLGVVKSDLEQLLRESDVISIHAPLLTETYRMFNRERLAMMKDSCILINTARGGFIDEEALIEELRKGRLFACLDGSDPEPPAADHPFRTLPNVVMTPHAAGGVNNGLHRIAELTVANIRLLLDGKPMIGEIIEEQLSYLA